MEVSVFEKSRGVGGRLSTRRSRGDMLDSSGEWQCDHGAPFFSATTPEFSAEVSRWVAQGFASPWAARWKLQEVRAVQSEQDALAENPLEKIFVGFPSMNAIAKRLAQEIESRVLAEHTVTRIQKFGAMWTLETKEHGVSHAEFDAVILAVPAPQAAALLESSSGCVPDHFIARAETAQMAPDWTVMARFAASTALPFDAARTNNSPLELAVCDRSKPGRSGAELWVLHASAAWSAQHLEASPEFVVDALMRAFKELGAPAPESVVAHRWRFANASATFDPTIDTHHASSWDATRAVGMIGDWNHSAGVEGAWLSANSVVRAVFAEPTR